MLIGQAIFDVAGFRPGKRGPFVPAKGPKTIDAQSDLIGWDRPGKQEGGPTRSAQTRPAKLEERPSPWSGSRRRKQMTITQWKKRLAVVASKSRSKWRVHFIQRGGLEHP